MYENPFTPSFGEIPAHLAGRTQIVSDLIRALSARRRRPELTTILVGARGTGKTTLLSLLAEKAEQLGWVSVGTTALPGMLEDIELQVGHRAEHLLQAPAETRLTGIETPIGGISLEHAPRERGNWRLRMGRLLEQLGEKDVGLLLTVDEVDPSLDEMIELAAIYQHFVRDGYRVALLMAGLPHNVSALLSNKTVSFLRRAQNVRLGRVADFEVEDALRRTIEDNGRQADAEGLRSAVTAIQGFPFLMQLVGFRAWDAHPAETAISLDDFDRGIELARREMEDRILEATYRELSPEDRRFARAMLADEGDSRIADLVTRLDRSTAQVAQYRRRLIDAGVIGERERGVVGFDLPYFREYLSERAEE